MYRAVAEDTNWFQRFRGLQGRPRPTRPRGHRTRKSPAPRPSSPADPNPTIRRPPRFDGTRPARRNWICPFLFHINTAEHHKVRRIAGDLSAGRHGRQRTRHGKPVTRSHTPARIPLLDPTWVRRAMVPGAGDRHARLHGPRARDRPARPDRRPHGCLWPGRDPLRDPHRPPTVLGPEPHGRAAAGDRGPARAAEVGRAGGRPGDRGHRAQGPGEGSRGPLPDRRGPGARGRAVPRRRAGRGPARALDAEGQALGEAASPAGYPARTSATP